MSLLQVPTTWGRRPFSRRTKVLSFFGGPSPPAKALRARTAFVVNHVIAAFFGLLYTWLTHLTCAPRNGDKRGVNHRWRGWPELSTLSEPHKGNRLKIITVGHRAGWSALSCVFAVSYHAL